MGKKYRSLRHPKTTQEIREHDPKFDRDKRSHRNLPNVRDDIYIHEDKCWKKKRKTKWKER